LVRQDSYIRPKSAVRRKAGYGPWCLLLGSWLLFITNSGCISTDWARLRRVPRNALASTLQLNSRRGPQPTEATLQILRRYDLDEMAEKYPEDVVPAIQEVARREPTAENVYAVAELAYVGAKRLEKQGCIPRALDLFGTSVANAFIYLFDEQYEFGRNPYDPRFRSACDLYNSAFESSLRQLQKKGMLIPGKTHRITTTQQTFDVTIAARGTWHEQNFDQLKFVSDFDVHELRNLYRTPGLGVPMIGVYRSQRNPCGVERFYPPGMSFPATAFLRVDTDLPTIERAHYNCTVELHDPLNYSTIELYQRVVPLETDLTTPLAYALDNPMFQQANAPSRGLFKPEESSQTQGLYLLEPYDPQKIPVLMVHGFWSSLVTWMEMFNDLRGTPEIRDHFQFWFYLYPSGQPFWYTAGNLRQQLALARKTLDPDGRYPTLDQMVLVGHSAGGLVSKLQTLHSGDDFWHLVSPKPLEELKASPKVLQNLQETFYFCPDKSIRRVITIATPHRGSTFSNSATQWLSRNLIKLPKQLLAMKSELEQANPGYFCPQSALSVPTNVDALAPGSEFLGTMLAASPAPWVVYHNIVGLVQETSPLAAVVKDSDGVVGIESARLPGATSEIVVPADHANVHRHPLAILEVRRILLEHLTELQRVRRLPAPGEPNPLASRPLAYGPSEKGLLKILGVR
jgi:pimeloyl-ACP methyl ester carboxylesterase